jgi:hypothetical protein
VTPTETSTLLGDADTEADTPTVCATPAETPADTPDVPADTVTGPADTLVPELPEPPDPPAVLDPLAVLDPPAVPDPLGALDPLPPVLPAVVGAGVPPEPDPDAVPLPPLPPLEPVPLPVLVVVTGLEPVPDPALPLALVPDPLAADLVAVVTGSPVPSPVPPFDEPDDPCADDRVRELRWPPAPIPPTPRLVHGQNTGADDPGGPPVNAPPDSAGREPPPAGRCKIRTDTDISTNSAMSVPVTMVGTRLTAGCCRMTAIAFLSARRVRSRPSATMSCGSGSAGPKPRLASWRSLRSAAFRCLPVNPGSKYTVAWPRPRL